MSAQPPPEPRAPETAEIPEAIFLETAAAFEEWARRFEENPDGFALEFGEVDGVSYGEAAARYFFALVVELGRKS